MPEAQTLAHGQFAAVSVQRPAEALQGFALLLAEGDTPSAADLQLARSMARAGTLVATVALPPYWRRATARDGQQCVFSAGDFENLARHVQAYYKAPTYFEPMLVGSGGNAAGLAYALFAQAPAGTFTGALSLGFCPRLTLAPPPCAGNALRWRVAGVGAAEGGTAGTAAGAATASGSAGSAGSAPGAATSAVATATGAGVDLQPAAALSGPWFALPPSVPTSCTAEAVQTFVARTPQAVWLPAAFVAPGAGSATASATQAGSGGGEPTPGFDAAFARLAAHRAPLGLPPTQLSDLPVVEEPVAGLANGGIAAPDTRAGKTPDNKLADKRFVVIVSGDGGWAGIDKGLAAAMVKQGLPVVGLDSLRYFWTARTPQRVADDLDRVIRYYAARWKRSEVVLIGYSQGADVLPFAVNRLPARTRSGIKLTALLGLGQKASFEFHVANWIGPSGDQPIEPEARRLSAVNTLCIYGSGERDSLCPQLAPQHARALALPGGHHFGGDYDVLAARILEALPR